MTQKTYIISIYLLIIIITSTIPITTAITPSHALSEHPQITFHEEHLQGRRFLWQAPTTPLPEGGYPALFVLHGATQYAETWFLNGKGGLKGSLTWGKRQTEFTQQALEHGFFIIAPDSQRPFPLGPKAWDSTTPDINASDDLQFIQNIITWTHNTSISINQSQLFCIGFSSGGFMTNRIGITLGTSFQALAIHSAGHADTLLHPTHQTAPAISSPLENHPPTLIIHGNKDQLVPVTLGIELHQFLQENDIRTHILLNPYGRHIWQSLFNQLILDWFHFGYHTACPPEQPEKGPGSTNYSHQSIKTATYGQDEFQYWLFEPQNPTPASAPVIVFNHGWGAQHPSIYQSWIDHIVKQGNIVIYPRYQKTLVFGFKRFTDNAIYAVQQALDELQNTGHVTPQLDHFAIVGHSLGGGISTYMAARAAAEGLPIPQAIMPVQPALPFGDSTDLQLITNETYMLVVVGENDTVVFNYSALPIFYDTTGIPLDQKDYIIQLSDFYGYPGLSADHGAPTCSYNNSVLITDAMDYYSTWKLFDALIDYAFYGINQEYCFNNTPEQRYMGEWSDGTPVTELIVTDFP